MTAASLSRPRTGLRGWTSRQTAPVDAQTERPRLTGQWRSPIPQFRPTRSSPARMARYPWIARSSIPTIIPFQPARAERLPKAAPRLKMATLPMSLRSPTRRKAKRQPTRCMKRHRMVDLEMAPPLKRLRAGDARRDLSRASWRAYRTRTRRTDVGPTARRVLLRTLMPRVSLVCAPSARAKPGLAIATATHATGAKPVYASRHRAGAAAQSARPACRAALRAAGRRVRHQTRFAVEPART